MTKVYVAGHAGMVGSAIVRQLTKLNDSELLYAPRPELDLYGHRCSTELVF